jgi:hypothetical protein
MRSSESSIPDHSASRSGFVTFIGWLGIVAGVLTLLAGMVMAKVLDVLLSDPEVDADVAKLADDPHVPAVMSWLLMHPSAIYLATMAFGLAVVVVSIALLRRRRWGRIGVLGVLWLGIVVNLAGAALTVFAVRSLPTGVAQAMAEMGGDFDRIAWGLIATVVGGVAIVVALHALIILRISEADEFD